MKFKRKTLMQIADMICGNLVGGQSFFVYRSSSRLSEFFEDCDTAYRHDGSTRNYWVAGVLEEILNGPQPDPSTPPHAFLAVIRTLMNPEDATNEGPDRSKALAMLNATLAREGFEAFYADDGFCYLRDKTTKVRLEPSATLQRPLSKKEQENRDLLSGYLDKASEDDLTMEILLPLFRQLSFQRITVSGHRDKALEYGKDIWMKYRLPTLHQLYFGIQVKRGRLDAAARSKTDSANIAEVLAQIRMMLGHTIFDPEINKKRLVDHAIIIASGEITKAARNWIGEQLDASARSQILFMDRNDILDLFVLNNAPLSEALVTKPEAQWSGLEDEIPF